MINTHKQSDTNYTLRLASIKPHFQPIHALWCCIPAAEECNQNTQSHEPDGKWTGFDWARPWVCSWSCWWRIQAGWLVEVWCSGSLFAHIYFYFCSQGIFSKIWNPVLLHLCMHATFWEMHFLLLADGKREDQVSKLDILWRRSVSLLDTKTTTNHHYVNYLLTVNASDCHTTQVNYLKYHVRISKTHNAPACFHKQNIFLKDLSLSGFLGVTL